MNAKKLKVLYFGQTPEQLFESKHCKNESNQPIKGYNNEYKLNNSEVRKEENKENKENKEDKEEKKEKNLLINYFNSKIIY